MPLNYYGAHTGRWAASRQGINLQTLKRGSFLRSAICAPEGHTLVVGDLAQIEPRVLGWISGYDVLLSTFRSGKDVYSTFGAQMFNVPGMTKESHPVLRQSAKSALLGCGYGMSWPAFAMYLIAGFLGAPPIIYDLQFLEQLGGGKRELDRFLRGTFGTRSHSEIIDSMPRTCSREALIIHCCATREIVIKYRQTAKPVEDFWKFCKKMLAEVLTVPGKTHEYKGLTFCNEGSTGYIFMPNGMALQYPDLQEHGGEGWSYDPGKGNRKKIYGPKVTENIVQALARIIMTDGALRIQKKYPIVHTAHDELTCVVRAEEAEDALHFIETQMTADVPWMPGIPLAAEVHIGRNYGAAKS